MSAGFRGGVRAGSAPLWIRPWGAPHFTDQWTKYWAQINTLQLSEYSTLIKSGSLIRKLGDRIMADFWLDNAKNFLSFSIFGCKNQSFGIFAILGRIQGSKKLGKRWTLHCISEKVTLLLLWYISQMSSDFANFRAQLTTSMFALYLVKSTSQLATSSRPLPIRLVIELESRNFFKNLTLKFPRPRQKTSFSSRRLETKTLVFRSKSLLSVSRFAALFTLL